MTIYLCNAGFDFDRGKAIERRLRDVLPELTTISSIAEVLSGPAHKAIGETQIVILAPTNDRRTFDELIDTALRPRDGLFIILISDEISIGQYKAIVRTGGADWVSSNADAKEVLDIIMRRDARTAAERKPTSAKKPAVISFVSSTGGAGNTTLAVEIGVQLKSNKATRHRRICLVDLDFQCSNVCDYIDIEPRLQIQEISNDPERLDAQLFDIFISRHASGLDVFAAPRAKFQYCDLDVSALDTLFSIASTRYDLILIDLPVVWFAWTPRFIEVSEAVVVTGVNTVPGLRQIAETLAAVRQISKAPAKILVAINRCRRRLFGGIVRRQHVESTLAEGEQIIYVGEEPMALESVNTGTPMVLNPSCRAIRKDIAALAAICLDVTPADTR